MCESTLLFLFVWMSLSDCNKAFAVPVFKNPLKSMAYGYFALGFTCCVRGLLPSVTFWRRKLGTWVTPVTSCRTLAKISGKFLISDGSLRNCSSRFDNKIRHLLTFAQYVSELAKRSSMGIWSWEGTGGEIKLIALGSSRVRVKTQSNQLQMPIIIFIGGTMFRWRLLLLLWPHRHQSLMLCYFYWCIKVTYCVYCSVCAP